MHVCVPPNKRSPSNQASVGKSSPSNVPTPETEMTFDDGTFMTFDDGTEMTFD